MERDELQFKDNKDRNQKFLGLFIFNQKRIFAFIQALVLRRSDAEDIMQETIMAMWQMFDEFDPESNFAAWGMQIARFRILKYRKERLKFGLQLREKAFLRILNNIEKVMEDQDERLSAMEICLKKLTDSDDKLLRMRYQEGLSIKNVAEKLNRSVHGMYKVMARIHTMLQLCIRRTLSAWEIET